MAESSALRARRFVIAHSIANARVRTLGAVLPKVAFIPGYAQSADDVSRAVGALFVIAFRFERAVGVAFHRPVPPAARNRCEAIAMLRLYAFSRRDHELYLWSVFLAELGGAVAPGTYARLREFMPFAMQAVAHSTFDWIERAPASARRAFYRLLDEHLDHFERARASRPNDHLPLHVRQANYAMGDAFERVTRHAMRSLPSRPQRGRGPSRVRVARRTTPRQRRARRSIPVRAGPPATGDEPPSSDDDPSRQRARGPGRGRGLRVARSALEQFIAARAVKRATRGRRR